MSMSPSTPLWLNLKKEHIDENFEKVLQYLRDMAGNGDGGKRDDFYEETLKLVQERALDAVEELAAEPMHRNFADLDSERCAFRTRLLGAALMLDKQSGKCDAEMLFAFFRSLSQLTDIAMLQELYDLAIKNVVAGAGECPGLGWDALIDFNPQILAHRIMTSEASKIKTAVKERYYEGHGLLRISDKCMQILPLSLSKLKLSAEKYSACLKIADDRLQLCSAADDRLKQSDAADYLKIDQFVQRFTTKLNEVKPSQKQLPTYNADNLIDVRVISITADEIMLETIDPQYKKITAPLKKEGLFFYTSQDWKEHFREGDYFRALLCSEENPSFSINKTLSGFLADAYVSSGEEMLAFARKVDRKKVTWWTECGFPAYSDVEDDVAENDFCIIRIDSINQSGYAYATYVSRSDEKFDEYDSKSQFINNFIYGDDFVPPGPIVAPEQLGRAFVDILSRFSFSYQKTLPNILERYRYLAVCRALTTLTGDELSSKFLAFVGDYLRDLAFFAQGRYDGIKPLEPAMDFADLPSVMDKVNTVAVLSRYGAEDDSTFLSDIIKASAGNPQLVKIAKLVQSCNRISGIVSRPMLNSIKREITKSLSVDSEAESDLDEDNGIYLGMEDLLHEFKTSFVFPPDNRMAANLEVQSRNVYKGLCAFLNSEAGGTFYLGVSDLGYVVGVDNDLKELNKNLDGYIRLIQDEAKKYFDINVIAHWDFKVLYDGKVVAITVRPYEIGVVELLGKAYVRLCGESVEMSEDCRKQLTGKRLPIDKNKVSNLIALQTAIREHKKAVLHKYASSNSGRIDDRNVEPYSITKDGCCVWCYELDDEANKVFTISRAEYVEVLPDEWDHARLHCEKRCDVFRTSGDKPVKVCLQLDLMAKNLLCEEYPEAKTQVSATKDKNVWMFNAEVFKIESVGRFYLGLSDHIVIVDSPELVQYAKEMSEKILGKTFVKNLP